MSLTVRILIGMVAGFLLGSLVHALALPADGFVRGVVFDGAFHVGGQIFLNSLKLLVVPLVLVSIVCGASNISDGATMGRVGGKALGLYLFTTAAAITLALTVALIVDPGEGMNDGRELAFEAQTAPSITDTIIDILPSNPVAAMAEGNMLQIIVFAILFGVAINFAGEAGHPRTRMRQLRRVGLCRQLLCLRPRRERADARLDQPSALPRLGGDADDRGRNL